ncbi:heterokaryon incompatibility protein-domain-containing protein [Xylaria sp. FL1042]|nr:heterokaryon incompatibility protein-domain-containing protein [Xylaria sp. FL1042]
MDPTLNSTDENTTSLKTRENNGLADIPSFLHAEQLRIQQEWQGFTDTVCAIQSMFEDLSKKDSRFISLKAAADHFLVEDFGVNDRLDHLSKMINSCLSTDHNTDLIKEELLQQREDLLTDEGKAGYTIYNSVFELIVCAIFELLSIYKIPLTIQDVPIELTLSAYLSLLRDLYTRTKDIELEIQPRPQSTAQTASQPNGSKHDNSFEQKEYNHVYRTNLDLSTDQVRVVELLPGTGDNPIMCNLKVCTIDNIEEALSYVWGQKEHEGSILVDQQSFRLTQNLYDILCGLRYPDTVRTLWIDAICIDQSNVQERTHQVRLMRHIYSKAQKTIIWLHDNKKPPDDPDEVKYSTPLPSGFGGTTMNEYDLASILREIQQHEDSTWNKKKLALFYMLYRCLKEILSHEWWNRIWTLQEGALPPSEPTILFRGHSFSFNDVRDSAHFINKVGAIEEEKFHRILSEVADNSEEGATDFLSEIKTLAYALSRAPSRPLLFELRPRGGKIRDKKYNIFYILLLETKTHNATCPEDKIFALESLLLQCIGNLIFPDYRENCEVIFRRATARCYNAAQSLNSIVTFDLRFESTNTAISALSGPSWVLDFSFCDSSIHNNERADKVTDTVTLNGFIFHNAFTRFEFLGSKVFHPLFATPKTLFCTGISIDRVYQTGAIPSLVKRREFSTMIEFLKWICAQSQQRLEAEGFPRLLDATRTGDSSRNASKTFWFFLMDLDGKIPRGEFSMFCRKRFEKISKKP